MNTPKKLALRVEDPWLFHIQVGSKKVEGRRGTYEKFSQLIGNKVSFYNKNRNIPVKVLNVRHYETLHEYLDTEGYQNVLPGVESYEKAIEIYHQFYSDDKIKEAGGMCGIVVELVQ